MTQEGGGEKNTPKKKELKNLRLVKVQTGRPPDVLLMWTCAV